MRELFLAGDAATRASLRWRQRRGECRRIIYGVYGEGLEDPTPLDMERATVLVRDGIASGHLAGVLLNLDSVALDDRPLRRRELPAERIVRRGGVMCTNGLQTMVDLAATLDDDSGSRRSNRRYGGSSPRSVRSKLETRRSFRGVQRIRRVLALRPSGAPRRRACWRR